MTQQEYKHPIAPPRELVQRWIDCDEGGPNVIHRIATRAAQWGADKELKACCEWMEPETPDNYINALRAARRLKLPNLKEQALALLDKAEDPSWDISDFSVVRRALEQLPDHE